VDISPLGKLSFILPYGSQRRPQLKSGFDRLEFESLRELIERQLRTRAGEALPFRLASAIDLTSFGLMPDKPGEDCHAEEKVSGHNVCRGAPQKL
jgi:hypothetical protein